MVQKAGLSTENIRKDWQLINEKPFDSVTKMMTVVVKNHQTLMFTKGASESILNVCDKILIGDKEIKMTGEQKDKIEKQVIEWAKQGLRVLAFGYKQLNQFNQSKSVKLVANSTDSTDLTNLTDSTFLGMVAIHDAPRPEVKEAIFKAKRAGIKVIMITGDNEKTAEAIGVSSGLIKEGDEILTGLQLDKYDDHELLIILPRVKIFARTNPFQKHRIVSLYQKLGEIVAVTGDGVNDAIALKQADVGVAMGLVGTDVARETADMVITAVSALMADCSS